MKYIDKFLFQENIDTQTSLFVKRKKKSIFMRNFSILKTYTAGTTIILHTTKSKYFLRQLKRSKMLYILSKIDVKHE